MKHDTLCSGLVGSGSVLIILGCIYLILGYKGKNEALNEYNTIKGAMDALVAVKDHKDNAVVPATWDGAQLKIAKLFYTQNGDVSGGKWNINTGPSVGKPRQKPLPDGKGIVRGQFCLHG